MISDDLCLSVQEGAERVGIINGEREHGRTGKVVRGIVQVKEVRV